MADISYNEIVAQIHQGPAFIYWNCIRPPASGLLLVNSSGVPTYTVASGAGNTWTTATAYAVGQQVWDAVSASIQEVTTPGTTSGSVPTFSATVGTTTTDAGGVVWTCMGVTTGLGATQGATNVNINTTMENVMIDQETGPVDAIMTADMMSVTATLTQSQMSLINIVLPASTLSTGTNAGLPVNHRTYEMVTAGGLKPIPRACMAVVSPRRDLPGAYLVACLYQAYTDAKWTADITIKKETVYKVTFTGLTQIWRTNGDKMAQLYRQTQ